MEETACSSSLETEWARWRMRPADQTSALVRRFAGWWEESGSPVRRWETPSGGMSLIVSFGPKIRVSSTSSPEPTTVESFVVGMYEEPALTEHDGSGFGVQIDLTAEGGYALVDGPLDELANRVVSLEEVCPQLATGRLVDRLLSARSLAERIVALRQEVALSVTGARRLSPEVAWVHRQLRREPNTKVGRLASELNWRPARLVNAFRREVGLPPKSIGRLARFDRARDHLAGGKPITLAEIAARCGYADQAHFNREFRAFSGRTPTQWRSEQSAG